jgi:hypothetical protein
MSQNTTVTSVPCPRCKNPLVDPNGLGWCKSCGYCRSLAEAETETRAPRPAKTQPNALTATGGAVLKTPVWFWGCLCGTAAIGVGTFIASHQIALTDFQRALFCTLEIVAGLGLMFCSQFFGLLRLAPEDPSLSFKDAIVPIRLYGLIFQRLPDTQKFLCLGTWGLTAIVMAAIFVGGLGHWFTYLPNKSRSYNVVTIPKG